MSNASSTEHQMLWLRRTVLLLFGLAVLQHMLPPNGFAGTVMLFDYSFGLIRRGLLGTLANAYWGDSVTPAEVFTVAALTTLAGLIALLAYVLWAMGKSVAGLLLALLLFGSFAFRAIVGSTGYMDLILIALVSCALFYSAASATGVILRAVACALGLFFHEVMLPYFAVFLAVDIWINRRSEPLRRRAIWSAVPFAAALAAFALLSVKGTLPADQVPAFNAHIAQKADFTPDPEATIVMGRTITDNFVVMDEKRQEMGYLGWLYFDGIPLGLMSLWLLWLNFAVLGAGRSALTKLGILAAILAPLSLNIIAFDVVRFGAISVLVGFLLVISQTRNDAGAMDRLTKILTFPVALFVLALNLGFTMTQLNIGDAQEYALPWVFLHQLGWF